MLNDLFVIERGLAAQGIAVAAKHPDIKDMAKGWAFRVRLAADGSISDISIIDQAGQGAVWTLRDGQHNGFPGLKTSGGLLDLSDAARAEHEERWGADKSSGARRAEVQRLLRAFPYRADLKDWPSAGHRRRIGERLDALRSLFSEPKAASVPATFERFLLAVERSPSFLEEFAVGIGKSLGDGGTEWIEPAREALVGAIPLVLDVDKDDFPRNASDPRQIPAVSDALTAVKADAAEADATCSLTGEATSIHSGNFPQPNLPGLGQTYLYSRNKDIPSLTRYGRTSDASFQVGDRLVQRLAGALEALTRQDARGKTWRLIPAEKGDSPDLMIVGFSEPSLQLADAMADDDDDDAVAPEVRLLQLAENVVVQSRGIHRQDHVQDQMTVTVLRTVDPANRQSVYNRSLSPETLLEAARRWRDASRNAPDWVEYRLPVKGRKDLVLRKTSPKSPLTIVRLSRSMFVNGGKRQVDAIGVPAAEAFAIFLGDGDVNRRAGNILRLLCRRQGGLLAGLAHASRKGGRALKDFDPKFNLRRDALLSAGWIGALLHKLGRTKEGYMSDTAFKLGQLLNAADTVHVGYCADLRGGDVPPTLLGNSIFAIAGGDPTRALSIFQRRWKPYDAWARRARLVREKANRMMGGKDEQRAWDMRHGLSSAARIRPLAEELHVLISEGDGRIDKPDDKFRAELLLGYMAGIERRPGKDKIDPGNAVNDSIEVGEDGE